MNCINWLRSILLFTLLASTACAQAKDKPLERIRPALANAGVQEGDGVFIRIYKHDSRLELFMENNAGEYRLVKSYPICAWSGDLGPKLREGDGQSPEGFYWVSPSAMNPHSSYHLSFNLGFPNAYDQAHGRTGSFLMVHGACVSIGCYAMTDPAIEEIYALMEAAFANDQAFIRVHIFPYDMSEPAPEITQASRWQDYWAQLKIGHDWFVHHDEPPNVDVKDGRYVFSQSTD